ncbi:MAG: hypothetical protein CSB33_05165 [Desulfobacterales bacterium]|nr:MAG: hypothetical protein CSB33_05165 [Desulfobacterales bacterium]
MKARGGEISAPLVELLESRLGINLATLGQGGVERALQSRMTALNIASMTEYAARLQNDGREWQALVDLLMVTETCFFRYPDAFVHLGRLAVRYRNQAPPRPVFRVLSAPCATGEEACSIALCLIAAGMAPEEFIVDAVDISCGALDRARQGVYDLSALNRAPSLAGSPYLHRRGNRLEMDAALMERIRYRHADLLSDTFAPEGAPYPVIFCRNMMIYLYPEARLRAGRALARFLTAAGRMFVGHAEPDLFREAGFAADHAMNGAFALKKSGDTDRRQRGFLIRSPLSAPVEPPALSFRPAAPGYGLEDDAAMEPTFDQIFDPSSIHAPDPASEPIPDQVPSYAPSDSFSPAASAGRLTNGDAAGEMAIARRLADEGKLDQALSRLKDLVEVRPAWADAWFLKGLIYESRKDARRAESCFSRAVYLNPEHLEGLRHLAALAETRGDCVRADALRRRIQRIRERNKNES